MQWALLGLKSQGHIRCSAFGKGSQLDTSKQMCVSKLPGEKALRVTRRVWGGGDPSKCQETGGICQIDKQGNMISATFDSSGGQIL